MKEQTGNTKVQINAEEIGKPSEKSIQNNDSKADRNPWKLNGENTRINYEISRRIKEKEYRDKLHNYKIKIL